jgi:hypothetical protein
MAVTTLAIVTLLVWVAALFIPAGTYRLDRGRLAQPRHVGTGRVAADLR